MGFSQVEMGVRLCYTEKNDTGRWLAVEKIQTEVQCKLNEQTEARIAQMERPDYAFPERFSRKDYLLWGVVTGVSLLLVILGVRL